MLLKEKRKKSISIRLTYFIICLLLICFAVLTIIISLSTSKHLISSQQRHLEVLAENNAQIARDYMQSVVSKQIAFASSLKSIGNIPPEYRNSYLQDMVKDSKAIDDDILSMFLIYAPNPNIPTGCTIYSTNDESGLTLSVDSMLTKEQYQKIEEFKDLLVIDPYKKTIDKKEHSVITVLLPIIDDNGNFMGLVGSDVSTSLINDAKYNTGGYETFYNLIICGHKTVIVNTKNPDSIGMEYVKAARSTNPKLILDIITDDAKKLIFLDKSTDGSKDYRACVPFYIGSSKTVWVSTTSVSQKEFIKPIIEQLLLIIIFSIIILYILALCIYKSVCKVLYPIKEIEIAAKEMSSGNINPDILKYSSKDEIGNLADNIRTSMNVLNIYVKDIDQAMAQMESGNFNIAPTNPFIGDFASIERSITGFSVVISDTLKGINESATQVSYASNQVSEGAQELSEKSVEQSNSIDYLSKTMKNISVQINNNAIHSKSAKEQVKHTGDDIVKSNEKMQKMVIAMEEIRGKSNQISQIIKTIEDIAAKTNMLALNASIEANNAGEAGKGFSVVANEVRSLALKSAQAAKDTAGLIRDTVQAVEMGTNIVNETKLSLLSVVKESQDIITLVDEIAIETEKQSNSINEINEKIEEISDVVESNSAISHESAAASEELNAQARTLREFTGRFKLKEYK